MRLLTVWILPLFLLLALLLVPFPKRRPAEEGAAPPRKLFRAAAGKAVLLLAYAAFLGALFVTDPSLIAGGRQAAWALDALREGGGEVLIQNMAPLAQDRRTAVYQIEYTRDGEPHTGIAVFTKYPGIPLYEGEFLLADKPPESFAFSSKLYFGREYRFVLQGNTLTATPLAGQGLHVIAVGALSIGIAFAALKRWDRVRPRAVRREERK